MAAARVASFKEFWPVYLGEHRKPLTRALHFAGTNAALALAVAGIASGRPWLLAVALAVGYALAWLSHFLVEKNRPATFRYPLWSFAGDWKMWALMWTGRLGAELRRLDSGGAPGLSALPLLAAAALAAVAATMTSAGCTTLPAPVVVPGATRPTTPAVTFGGDWGWASGHIQRPNGTTQEISGNGDQRWGSPNQAVFIGSLVPAIASLHFTGVPWDGGIHAGWRRLGGTARRRLHTSARGAATSATFAGNVEWSFQAADVSAGIEEVLPVGGGALILGRLGLGLGRWRFDLEVPSDLDTTAESWSLDLPGHFNLFRYDGRLNGMLGVGVAGGALVFGVHPYLVLVHSDPRGVSCDGCTPNVQLLDFTQTFGLAVMVTLQMR